MGPTRLLSLLALILFASGVQAQDYKTAREARAAAAPHLRSRNYAAAQAPLEAALRLTPETDTAGRIDIYRALMASYRLLPEPEKMIEAVEYIQEHSPSSAERSLVAGDLANFMHQRGKTDEVISRYEDRLKKNAKDPTALAVLARVYARAKPDKERARKLEAELKVLNKERASAVADRLANEADAKPDAAASSWKEVARMWLEAENREQAKAAVDRSLKAAPESRTGILTMQWREGLGDVLMQLDDREEAIRQYTEAVKAAPSELLKTNVQKKLDKAKSATSRT